MRSQSKTTLLIIAIIIAILVILIIFINNRQQASKNEPNQIFQTDGITTATPQIDVSTPTTIVATLPAPRSGSSKIQNESTYFGGYLGDLNIQNNRIIKVYAPAYELNGTLLLPKDGLVLWGGHFIGHLIQTNGWLLIEQGQTISWIPLNGAPLYLQVESSTKQSNFNTGLTPLPQGSFDLVTCYIDFDKSTAQNRVFGGNVIYQLALGAQ